MPYLPDLFKCILSVLMASSVSCSPKKVEPDPELTLSVKEIVVSEKEAARFFHLESNVPWHAAADQAWVTLAPSSGKAGSATVELSIAENTTENGRKAVVVVSAGTAQKILSITQDSGSDRVPADKTGMGSDAMTLAGKMTYGWNLGNSLEAASSPTVADETLWGNPKTSKPLIDAVKAAGFNAVRIPCAWSGYIVDTRTYKISDQWLARVKEVVDYCVDNDMYAILNVHWDGGWLENNPTYNKQEEVTKKHRALWEQIGVAFRDYDEKLLFAGTNEVHVDYGEPSAENIEVQLSYNQVFVDAVRSTGGRNAWRNLIVQSYNTNIDLAKRFFKAPRDATADRLMLEVHYYDPWEFSLDTTSQGYLWGSSYKQHPNVSSWGQEDWVDTSFDILKSQFINKGIPVVMGEYGVMLRTGLSTGQEDHIKARNDYLSYVTKAAKSRGIVPFYWDNGHTGNGASGLFDRKTFRQAHPDAIRAITGQGASN